MDARLIKAVLPDLLPELRRLFTLALHRGLPAELKQGRTTFIPKKDKTSTDPSTYPPITVLPVLTRMFHEAVDIALRRHVYSHNSGLYACQKHLPTRDDPLLLNCCWPHPRP